MWSKKKAILASSGFPVASFNSCLLLFIQYLEIGKAIKHSSFLLLAFKRFHLIFNEIEIEIDTINQFLLSENLFSWCSELFKQPCL